MPPPQLRPLGFWGIGFAPETIAIAAICRAFVFTETMMTACLISLALAGLIAVAVCDARL
jgi:hypothetical protein